MPGGWSLSSCVGKLPLPMSQRRTASITAWCSSSRNTRSSGGRSGDQLDHQAESPAPSQRGASQVEGRGPQVAVGPVGVASLGPRRWTRENASSARSSSSARSPTKAVSITTSRRASARKIASTAAATSASGNTMATTTRHHRQDADGAVPGDNSERQSFRPLPATTLAGGGMCSSPCGREDLTNPRSPTLLVSQRRR